MSYLFWQLLNLDALLILLLVVGTSLLFTKWWRTGRTVSLITATLLVVACVSPIPDWVMTYLEGQYPRTEINAREVDGFILMGYGFDRRISKDRARPTFNCAAERITAVLEIASKYPNKPIYFMTGTSNESDFANIQEIFNQFFTLMTGKPVPKNITLIRSPDTLTCAKDGLEVAQPKENSNWVMVTSAVHMPRAMGVFRKAGWPKMTAYPVDYRSVNSYDVHLGLSTYHGLMAWTVAAYEVFSMATYYFNNKMDFFIPSPTQELKLADAS